MTSNKQIRFHWIYNLIMFATIAPVVLLLLLLIRDSTLATILWIGIGMSLITAIGYAPSMLIYGTETKQLSRWYFRQRHAVNLGELSSCLWNITQGMTIKSFQLKDKSGNYMYVPVNGYAHNDKLYKIILEAVQSSEAEVNDKALEVLKGRAKVRLP